MCGSPVGDCAFGIIIQGHRRLAAIVQRAPSLVSSSYRVGAYGLELCGARDLSSPGSPILSQSGQTLRMLFCRATVMAHI